MNDLTFSNLVCGMFRSSLNRWERNQRVSDAYDGELEHWRDRETDAPLRLSTGNKFKAVLDGLADGAARMPAVSATAQKSSEAAMKRAQQIEDAARWFLSLNNFDLMLPLLGRHYLAYGVMAVTCVPDEERVGAVKWRVHDPRFVAFNMDYVGGNKVREVVVGRRADRSKLEREYADAINTGIETAGSITGQMQGTGDQKAVMIVEYFSDTRYITGIFELDSTWDKADDEKRLSLLDQVNIKIVSDIEHNFGCCPAIIAHSPSINGEIHGQAEAALPAFLELLNIHAKVQRYATQMVSGPIVLRGYILNQTDGQKIDVGPDSVVHLEETSTLERMPPATTSFGLQAELDRYDADFYTAFRSSRALIGDVPQSQASGSFVDAISSAQTDSMVAFHSTARNFIKRLLDTSLMISRETGGKGEVEATGQFRGADFKAKFVPNELDLTQPLSVHYGSAFGRDRAGVQLVLQSLYQSGGISLETLLTETEGIDNPTAELARIRNEQVEALALGLLQQAAVEGRLSPRHVVELMKATQNHDSLLEVFESYAADDAQNQQAQQLGLPQAPEAVPPGGAQGPAMMPLPPIDQYVGQGGLA